MRNRLCLLAALALVHASSASAQFGQNPFTASPPGNSTFLPRAGGQRLNNQQFYPFGYGNPLNNYYNGAFGNNGFGSNGWNQYGNYGFGGYGSPYNSAFGNPWQGSPFGGGVFNNPYQTPWGFGNSAPFGGYQYNGYGNFAPIVGLNNGWWPYQPAYNYNNPVDQYLNQLFLQGLPGSGSAPSSLKNNVLPRNP